MLILLLIAFIAYVVAELYVLIQVGQAIGALNTIGLMILISLVGVWLAKHEGLQVLTRLRQQIDAKRMPTDELIDGGLILAGGLFLILPGFISDAIGIFVLFPPTRALVRGVHQAAAPHRHDHVDQRPLRPARSATRRSRRHRRLSNSGTTGQSGRAAASIVDSRPRGPATRSTRSRNRRSGRASSTSA